MFYIYKNHIISKKNEKSNNNDVKNKKKVFDEVANIVSKSTNPYFYNFDIIMSALKELQRIRSGSLDNFDKIDIWVENEKGKHKELKVSVDGRISTSLIDNDIFRLDDKDKLLKVRMNGTLLSINIDKNVLEIDIQNRLSNIYCLFGSNRYEKAGFEAQCLIKELKISQKILEEINKEQKNVHEKTNAYSLISP